MSDRTRSLPGIGLRKTCGCAPARWIKCHHPWQWAATIGGKQIRRSLKTANYDEAMRLRAEWLATKGKGRPAPMTFAQVAEKNLGDEAHAGKDDRRYHVKGAERLLDARPIDEFEPEDIEALRAAWITRDRGKHAAPGVKDGRTGAKRMLATIRHVFN